MTEEQRDVWSLIRGRRVRCVARGALRALLAAALVLSLPLIGPGPPSRASINGAPGGGEQEQLDLLLITVDTLRADRLDSYGCGQYLAPFIDRLARRSVQCAISITQIPLTGPAHSSLLTGRYAHSHGVVRNTIPLRDDVPTLAEILSANGYQTAAFISGWTLRSPVSHLDRGFAHYDERLTDRYKMLNLRRAADETTDAVLAWLEKADGERPLFLWVHYFDPHDPYRRREKFLTQARVPAYSRSLRSKKLENYNSDVAFVDRELERMVRGFDQARRGRRRLTIFTADHGESFGEQHYWGHGRRVYDSNLRVPLIFADAPGLAEGRLSTRPAQTVDVLPTILQALGKENLTPPVDGESLLPWLRAAAPAKASATRRLYFETYPGANKLLPRGIRRKVTVRPSRAGFLEGDLKVIFTPRSGRLEIYDLAVDPAESHPLDFAPPRFGNTREVLRSWFHKLEANTLTVEQPELSREDQETLETLGYLE